MIAIAAPVVSNEGDIVATVAINATSARATTSDLLGFFPLLKQNAGQIAAFTEAE